MLEDIFSNSALNIVYGIVLLISFIFAVISLMGAEFGDVVDIDSDIDADPELDFVNISPFALAMFGAAFGVTGLITSIALGMGPFASLIIAFIAGLIIGLAAQVLFFKVLSPTKSSHYSLAEDAVGRNAQVIVTVPNDGVGTIAFDNVSGRVTLGARSITGKAIPTGVPVRIDDVTGRVALVRPLLDKASSTKALSE